MGWEKRGNGQYYYRKKRVNGKVKSQYVGAGEFAHASQVLDQTDSALKALDNQEWQETKATDQAIDHAVDQHLESIQEAIEQTLQELGYRKVKGEWRKKRMPPAKQKI